MRTRLSTLVLALTPCFVSTSVLAESPANTVMVIDDQLFSKHTELKNALQTRNQQQEIVSQRKKNLDQVKQQTNELNDKFTAAKTQLESDYQRMIDDPSVDLAATQANYQPFGNSSSKTKPTNSTLSSS
ncbi:hypothetical protein JCM19238_3913 [Vibrio ponticus]|nr:hypothetical protein JCM19238_3913 [Vibrio ponticus]